MVERVAPSYLHIVRAGERNWQYNLRSTLANYKESLQGIDGFLHYVYLYPTSRTIIDVGAGAACAVNELATSSQAKGLQFLATGLLAESNKYTGADAVPYLVTSAEEFEGIADASVGGMLANYSITYTDNPAGVVKAMERVLAPGGVIKAALHDRKYFSLDLMHNIRVQTAADYEPHFRAHGFDVVTNNYLLCAIKPGLQTGISATDLMQLDAFLYEASPKHA